MIKLFTKKRSKKGFTLIELVVVVAILGLLAALAIPRFTGSRDKASRGAILADLRTIESAITIAEAEGATYTDLASLATAGYLAAEPSGPADVTYSIVSKRAIAKFSGTTTYGFTAITAGTEYNLENLLAKQP